MIIAGNGQMFHLDINIDFPIRIRRKVYHKPGPIFKKHWHEEFMIFYIEQGKAVFHCNSKPIPVVAGYMIIINCNDIHYVENCCDYLVASYLIINWAFLRSQKDDLCQTKYITPLLQNHLRFHNKIENDNELVAEVLGLIHEYEQRNPGYELWVKAGLYRILVLLMRRHAVPIVNEVNNRQSHHLLPVLKFVDEHYDQKITLDGLSAMANITPHHLCRLFKSITGLPPISYVNHLRIDAAYKLLQQHQIPVSEAAMTVGFDDSNYFSRLFKKYKSIAPSNVIKEPF